jgi:hypothetical protein
MTPGRALIRNVALLLLAVVGPGCAGWPETATELVYVEHEPSLEPYRTRLIATGYYLRIDDGDDVGDFLLFDRRSRTIYSVSGTDRTVLAMPPRAVTIASPIALTHREDRDPAAFPKVGGRAVTHYRQWTNGRLCYDLYAAQDLLPQVVAAWREYREALAGQQVATVAATPKEYQGACDLANDVFRPGRYLRHGLPVRLTDADGKLSELVDYRELASAPQRLFTLPAEYRRMTIEELRRR